ncbi:MAG TPA: DMT family transporter [Burkholderiales bacterium]|nr:DMT family transporter [Burkholderiales bacterium]
MNGYLAAAIAVIIWASYPVATRAAVTGSFGALDLVALRFGLGGLLFLPYLLVHFRGIGRAVWLRGLPLTLFQGAGMGALVICGLQFAPASHQAALGPGVSPAWVALLGFVVFAKRPSPAAVFGAFLCAVGVMVLTWAGAVSENAAVLAGDAMFLAASALGALYVLQLRNWGLGAIQSAAIVSVYSALVVLPWYFCSQMPPVWDVAPFELLWQALWQGVLIGCVALVALNHAISRLGAERLSSIVAFVPVVSSILAMVFLGERPTSVEIVAILAICAGVSIGALRAMPASPLPAVRR